MFFLLFVINRFMIFAKMSFFAQKCDFTAKIKVLVVMPLKLKSRRVRAVKKL